MKGWLLFIAAGLCGNLVARAQIREVRVGTWGWVQLSKQISKRQTVGIQYQIRFRDYFESFDRSNIYLTYDLDLKQKWAFGALYQWNINREMDQHTFFASLSKKIDLGKPKLTYRTAVQHIQNSRNIPQLGFFPYTEWRNRLRLKMPLGKHFATSISYEPYLMFRLGSLPTITRARFVTNVSYELNKYTEITLFYLSQPSYRNIGQPTWRNVFGLTYEISLPRKNVGVAAVFDYTRKKKTAYQPK